MCFIYIDGLNYHPIDATSNLSGGILEKKQAPQVSVTSSIAGLESKMT
jgi:hypothetical protein